MKFSVERDLVEVTRFLSEGQKKYVKPAAGIALKRVATTTRNVAATRIREKLAIKAAVAKAAIKVRRIGMGMTLWIVASGKPIALKDYGASQTRKGITYRVSKGGGRKRYRTKYSQAWIDNRRGGHVFARVEPDPPGAKRGRMKKIYGPSVPQYFVTQGVVIAMHDTARARWPIEFAAALRGVLLRRTGVDIGAELTS